jgi:hypothetical protein
VGSWACPQPSAKPALGIGLFGSLDFLFSFLHVLVIRHAIHSIKALLDLALTHIPVTLLPFSLLEPFIPRPVSAALAQENDAANEQQAGNSAQSRHLLPLPRLIGDPRLEQFPHVAALPVRHFLGCIAELRADIWIRARFQKQANYALVLSHDSNVERSLPHVSNCVNFCSRCDEHLSSIHVTTPHHHVQGRIAVRVPAVNADPLPAALSGK